MKTLVIRMSSLGDIILATAFLENLPEDVQVDWIISSEFAFVLEGHPRIRKLISFDKKSGLKGWVKLLKEIHLEKYEVRVDLHRTLRSSLAFFLFWIWDLKRFQFSKSKRVSKQRFRNWLLLLLKGLTPKVFLPTPYWKRFAKVGKSFHSDRSQTLKPPSYLSCIESFRDREDSILEAYGLKGKKYFAIMPASRWRSKEWDPNRYVKVAKAQVNLGYLPLVLGREKDPACSEVVHALLSEGIPFQSGLREPHFKVTAVLLKHASFLLGSDTGLAHLAEAVGTRSFVIYGPTRPELGFGPWRNESRSIRLPIACAPCSKDGKVCYRFFSPYECMKKLSVESVLGELS